MVRRSLGYEPISLRDLNQRTKGSTQLSSVHALREALADLESRRWLRLLEPAEDEAERKAGRPRSLSILLRPDAADHFERLHGDA
jgi:hypothetical protein